MKKKLAVIGKGTVGALSVVHFLNYTDWEIEWIFDNEIPTSSVGEASNLVLPVELRHALGFTHKELVEIEGTIKQGIQKKYWNKDSDFMHAFPINSTAIHFNAKNLHDKIFNLIKNTPRLKIINKHVEDPEKLDADYVMVCSGSPKNLSNNHQIFENMVVNSAYIIQSEWDHPRFTYSLTNAMKYGWVFGIPLQKRISIGYLYNNKINTIEEIKKDIKNVFEEYNLKPSENVNIINFKSFYTKNNFSKKVVYNGNASFFLEPLEATSTSFSSKINRWAWDLWNGYLTEKECQDQYKDYLNDIENMILLHYMAGSIYKTKFWDFAKKTAFRKIKKEFKNNTDWSNFVFNAINGYYDVEKEFGTWGSYNYDVNVKSLKIEELIKSFKT